ncbi:transcriptional regulator [Sphingosinicella sp. BN140058]|uniref:winged helix-turn-helix domain-containing protein n=1 Tax=Sphingosinicella sp. BN140058 TaxID=1892855 RepID=UPI0013EB2C85|nr:transcriptional regulator [Sphingosinicella sp. BN140058]
MAPNSFQFDRFLLDPGNRRLLQEGVPVELNARYLDALILLVGEAGKLISKDRFLDQVWRGVPVTDEALTQCIRTLRRQLGDDAIRPRFIETVPKHGYRFIAEVATVEDAPEAAVHEQAEDGDRAMTIRDGLLLAGAGSIGAGLAGVIGGFAYGFAGAAQPLAPGTGAASVLLVLLWLTIAAALMGGAGVSCGIAGAQVFGGPRWSIVGGALGGMIVGGLVKLLGIDGFNLLLGRAPGDIAGGVEGLLLGGAVGVGAWAESRSGTASAFRRSIAIAAVAGGAGGLLVALCGGHLMAGSLDLLAQAFPGSRLRLDALGRLFGESGFGTIARVVTATGEGALFGAGIVGAMALARRNLGCA